MSSSAFQFLFLFLISFLFLFSFLISSVPLSVFICGAVAFPCFLCASAVHLSLCPPFFSVHSVLELLTFSRPSNLEHPTTTQPPHHRLTPPRPCSTLPS